jgi:hypothetical protein
MTTETQRTILAAAGAIMLVAIARALLAFAGDFGAACAIVVLFPGMVINLLTRGVHGSWDGFLSEAVMVGVPFFGWFIVIRLAIRLMAEKPIQPPRQTH